MDQMNIVILNNKRYICAYTYITKEMLKLIIIHKLP